MNIAAKPFRFFAGLCIAVLLSQPVAYSNLIYEDLFPGDVEDELDGTAPAVRPGTETWTAHPDIKADGTLTRNGSTYSGWLPFVPESGHVYTYAANVTWEMHDTQTTSLELSFQVADGGDINNRPNISSAATINFRRTGDVLTGYDAASFVNAGNYRDGSEQFTTLDFAMVLNTMGTDWVIQYYIEDDLVRTHTWTDGNPDITGIVIGKSGWAGGSINELTLIPEPGTASLLGLFGLIVWIRRRLMR